MSRSIAVMQPYFFPYIGYYQLARMVDTFVLYDNVEFTKSGWIHRNRILMNGKIKYISLSLRKDSDYKMIGERRIASIFFEKNRGKIIRQIENSYRNSEQFSTVMPVIYEAMSSNQNNLYDYLYHSIRVIFNYLNIRPRVIRSSEVDLYHQLPASKKLIAFCDFYGANRLINPIGGIKLYDRSEFLENGIKLSFLESTQINYSNEDGEVPTHLSIIDVLMNNSRDQIETMLNNFKLV